MVVAAWSPLWRRRLRLHLGPVGKRPGMGELWLIRTVDSSPPFLGGQQHMLSRSLWWPEKPDSLAITQGCLALLSLLGRWSGDSPDVFGSRGSKPMSTEPRSGAGASGTPASHRAGLSKYPHLLSNPSFISNAQGGCRWQDGPLVGVSRRSGGHGNGAGIMLVHPKEEG